MSFFVLVCKFIVGISFFVFKNGGIFLLILLMISCAGLKKVDQKKDRFAISATDIQLFESAFQDLGVENYSSAIDQLKKLAQKYKGQSLEWPVLYNLGSAYKESGQCVKARDIYEELMAKTRVFPLKQSRSKTEGSAITTPYPLGIRPRLYLSLSYVYECLGESEKRLLTLKEGKSYINHLTEETRLIEYPARLSLAYIERGELAQGLKIQKQLYQNLESLKKGFRISSVADESFTLYFYTIGRSHVQLDHVLLSSFLRVFSYHQTYLVQAVLLQTGQWSVRAEQELGDLYRKMWSRLKDQKNKKNHQEQIQKILSQLKQMTLKSKKMRRIYRILRKKTLFHLNS